MTALDHLPHELAGKSFSKSEILLSFVDALAALQHLAMTEVRVIGWEGWLLLPDGTLTPSERFPGTVDLSFVPADQAMTLCIKSIGLAQKTWNEHPEAADAQLLFSIVA